MRLIYQGVCHSEVIGGFENQKKPFQFQPVFFGKSDSFLIKTVLLLAVGLVQSIQVTHKIIDHWVTCQVGINHPQTIGIGNGSFWQERIRGGKKKRAYFSGYCNKRQTDGQ